MEHVADAQTPPADEAGEPEPFTRLPLAVLSGGTANAPEATVKALHALVKRSGEAYVIDVAGLQKNETDLDLVRDATRRDLVWWDAGSRYATDVMDLLIAGAAHVTVRFNTLSATDEFMDVAEDAEAVYLGLEFKDGELIASRSDPRATVGALLTRAASVQAGIVAIDLDGSSLTRTRIMTALGAFEGEKWFLANDVDAAFEARLREEGWQGVIAHAPAQTGSESRADEKSRGGAP